MNYFKLDLEAKKAKEAFKREQWELERKRARKILVPKCFMKINYWNPEAAHANSNSDEVKTLDRLQVHILFVVEIICPLTIRIIMSCVTNLKDGHFC